MFKEEIISNLYKVFQKTEQERNITLILESDQDNIHRSVSQFSCSVVSNSLQPHGLKHDRLPCPSPTPRACSNSCPLSRWCHPTISSSVNPFSSCKGFIEEMTSIFPSIRVFFSDSVIRIRWPKNWSFSFSISPSNEYSGLISFRWTGWITLQSKGLSRVFVNTTVQKHQLFGIQLSLQSNS